MKTSRLTLYISTALLLFVSAAVAQTSAQKSFDELKSLSGSWESKTAQGKTVTVTFRNTAGGSALMSEIQGEGPENMVSMFNLDGPDRLLITHYCGAGNQPRMAATTSSDGKTITFDFVDGTNLSSGPGHMKNVVFHIIDANHHTEEWTFGATSGKEMKEVFDLHRNEVAQR